MTRSTNPEQQEPTVRSLKERQREEREALILRAAYDVLVEKGYYEATIDEIAAQVGIAKGTVYLHFASKEDLVIALVDQQIVEFLALVDQVISEATTVRARLERILLHIYIGIQGERRTLLELTNVIGLPNDLSEHRVGTLARVAEVMERIAALFDEGKRAGELDTTVPTPIMVASFVALSSSHGLNQQLTSNQIASADLVTYVSKIFFESILAQSSKNTAE